jgi:hypothetical protein
MTRRAGGGQSRLPRQTLHRPTDLGDGVAELEVQSVVAGSVGNAFSNGELQEAANAVEVGANPLHLGKRLSVEGALQANPPEAASENLCPRAACLPSQRL